MRISYDTSIRVNRKPSLTLPVAIPALPKHLLVVEPYHSLSYSSQARYALDYYDTHRKPRRE